MTFQSGTAQLRNPQTSLVMENSVTQMFSNTGSALLYTNIMKGNLKSTFHEVGTFTFLDFLVRNPTFSGSWSPDPIP